MVYNLTQIAQNASELPNFVVGVSDVLVGGWLGVLILVGLAMVFFSSFIFATQDVKRSLLATSFICFGLSILMTAIGFVPELTMFIFLLISAAVAAFTWR